MTTPRGLTQPFTSFIGSACQGIHHAPLITNTQTTTHKHAGGHTSELDKKLIKEKRNHTNTHKQTTKAIHLVCLMLASTIQFSHNTPTTPCQHEPCQQALWSGTKKGIMPQTPNNAPTYKQQLLFTVHGQRVSQSAIQTLGLSLERVFHPDNFSIIKGRQHDTRILNQPQGCNCTRKIKAP